MPRNEADKHLEELMVVYYDDALRLAHRKAGNQLQAKVDVEGLGQTACRKVAQEMKKTRFEYRGDDEFRRFFLNAVERKINDKYRYHLAEKRNLKRERQLAPGTGAQHQPIAACGETPSGAMKRDERQQRIEAALAHLSAEERQVVQLRYLQKRTLQETSEAVGKSIGSVRNRLAKGLAKLSALLPDEL